MKGRRDRSYAFASVLYYYKAGPLMMPGSDSNQSNTMVAPPAPILELSSYHCGTCDKSVTSFDRGVACEGCGQWFHADCQSIGDSYEQLDASDVVWKCLVCDCANYSLTAFDLHDVGNTRLSFNSSLPSPETTSPKPLHSSTPTRQARQNKQKNRPLRFLNVNARSCVKNLPGMLNLIETTKPDVIFATETRLDGNIADSEILPPNYKPWRCDRNREGGGCFVAVADHLTSHIVPELTVTGMPGSDSNQSNTMVAPPAPISELSSYHCGTCDKSVTSFDRGVACEGCGQWFHADCQSIGDSYEQLDASDVVWKCLVCDCANYSLTAFDLHDVGNTRLSFNSSLPSPETTSHKPLHSSTPTRQARQNKQKKPPPTLP
ncbi:hypothetical protein EGW08_012920 [Elysia chlorotica]|uniref:PHD-type domain-containing protein n=1 Tax=Elysia chlorotica TaxID=188477 RepID=A0A3S1HH79_ELYCH|nr:hypothetical protein EGW08_012920 [Elysia chlorotica]